MAFLTSDIAEDSLSWSVSSPKASASDLLQLDDFDVAGDLAYIEENGRAYIWDSSASAFVLIKEKWGDSTNDKAAFRGWEDWGYGSRKLRAVEANGSGWVIALEHNWDGQSDWEVLYLDANGYISWDNHYWGDIKGQEYLFEVSGSSLSGDLNNDGVIGVNSSSFTTSSVDLDGANILADSDGYAYIKTGASADANVVAITDHGNNVRFNQSWSDGSWSNTEIATHAQVDTSGSVDVYKILVKQTSTSGSATETQYHVHTVNADGSFEWNTDWNVDLVSYETAFNADLDGDNVKGFNASNLSLVTTDDDASDTPASGAVFLKKNAATGSIYIFDNNISGSGNTIKIDDNYLEQYEAFADGGSYESTVVASHKNSFELDGDSPSSYHYLIAIKGTDTYQGTESVAWDIVPVESNGEVRWDYSSFTESIAGYEDLFGQDLDGKDGQGLDTGALTTVSADESDDGIVLSVSSSGAIFITDNGGTPLALKDMFGGIPSLSAKETWSDGSFEVKPYASVKKTVDSTDYYYSVFKDIEINAGIDGILGNADDVENVGYTIMRATTGGIIDFENVIETKSITTYEGSSWFAQDINGDGSQTGTVAVSVKPAVGGIQDTAGSETLGKDSEGAIYIVDSNLTGDGENVRINESWIEESHTWNDGAHSSSALAVREVNDAADSNGYYQVAVKNSDVWTDWQTGATKNDEHWQLYAFDLSGSEGSYQLTINWDKTIWTQSISNYEIDFGVDLDGSGDTGDIPGLALASTDTDGARLKKDSQNVLYIVDDESDNSPLMIADAYGGSITFDYQSDWGSGSHSSSAIAVDLNSDNSFSLLVKHTNTEGTQTFSDYEILQISSAGIIDWGETIWTQDIAPYETQFNQDFDGDESTGLNIASFSAVTPTTGFSGADLSGVVLKANSSTLSNESTFYITTSGGAVTPLNEEWGDSARLNQNYSWSEGSFSSVPTAIIGGQSYINTSGENITGGYAIALKNTDVFNSDANVSWEIVYGNSKGVIDGERVFTNSIVNYENVFNIDFNGDGSKGLNTSGITNNAITTDTTGDLLYKYDGALYFKDSEDNNLHQIIDQWGGTPSFNWSDSGGTGDSAWSYAQEAYAVESFVDGSTKKFLLAIKNTDSWGGGSAEISWETFEIKLNASTSKWELDWDTGSHSQGIARKETVFGQDMNGSGGGAESASSIATTLVATDISRAGGLTGVSLTKDSEGSFYIKKQDGSDLAIVDDGGMSVSLDWKDSFGNEIISAEAFAVEGVLDADGNLDYYKVAIKHSTQNNATSETDVQWETFKISSAGIIDWSSTTFGDAKRHESALNQDLDGDKVIWSPGSLTFTSAGSDITKARAYLDADKNTYIQPENSRTKNAVLDFGGLVSFNRTEVLPDGSGSRVESIEGVELVNDKYQLLIKEVETSGSDVSTYYSTLNVDKSTFEVDWGSFTWYENPASLETVFNLGDLDGVSGVAEINTSSAAYVLTDTTGAKLKSTSDGSLFIEDGSDVTAITGPNGGYVDFDFTDTWTGGSFSSEALAVQKVGTDYKLAVKETLTDGGNTDISYQIFTLKDTTTAALGNNNNEVDHVLNWGDSQFVVAADLNESEFGQDLTEDGQISNASSSAAFAKDVANKATDGEALTLIGQQAQSDVKAISNPKAGATDTQIEMFTGGVEGTAKGNYDLDVKIVQQASDALLAKVASDSAVSGGASSLEPLTGVMDFSVTINNPDNYGKVVSMSWILPEGTTNPVYMKKDQASGQYFDFKFDENTKQGYKWDSGSRTLKVYVKDNGRYDSDTTLGKVRDPGLIAELSSPSPSPSPSPSSSSSPSPSVTPTPLTPIPTPITPTPITPTPITPTPITPTPITPILDELPADVSDLGADDISILTPEALSALTDDQVKDLPPAAMRGFTADQMSELSDQAVAAFNPKQVKQLSPEAVTGLSKSQMSELSPKAVKGFTSDQVEQMPKKTFKALDTDQLSKLSKDAVTGLTSGQLKTLTGSEISSFKPGMIKSLDPDSMSGFKPKTLDDFTKRQVKSLSNDQLAGLSRRHFKKADDFVDALSNKQASFLSSLNSPSNSSVESEEFKFIPVVDPLA